jgi:alcohol dehydrogenase class IV
MNVLMNLPKIHFEFGAVDALASELARLGIDRPLMMTDRNLVECGVFKKVADALSKEGRFALFDQIPENPTVEGVEKAIEVFTREGCNGLVAVGGGSVIDSTKAAAVRAGHPGPLSRYDRRPDRITDATAPIIAIPTTAGTGSEVTSGAGIHPDPSTFSMNIGSPHLIPRCAICDPDLTMSLPRTLTAGTGMDALGQCVEGFLAKAENPLVDAIALDGIQRSLAYIEKAVSDGSDREARWNMLMAALEGGICINGKGLGPVHAIANTLGDQGHPHGILVALGLPSVLRFLEGHAGERMEGLAGAFGVEKGSLIAPAIEQLNERIGLPKNMGEMGYVMNDPDRAAELCVESIFNLASRRPPTHDQYKSILTEAMG